MEEAIDVLISAFPAYSCIAIPKRTLGILNFTLSDGRTGFETTKSIPFHYLTSNFELAKVIKTINFEISLFENLKVGI